MKSKENYSGVKGIFKFIANVVSWTALVILVILAIFLAYYTINTKLYSSRGEKFEPFISLYTIVSGSMEPNIKVWDVVVSKKVSSPNEIKVGDVITFTSTSSISRGMIVTHRVIEVKQTENGYVYRTKGDNNLSPDSAPAEYNNIIGKVIVRIPQLGRVQSFLGTQGGWLIVIVIPALFIIISDILKIFKLTGVKNKIEQMNEDEEKNRLQKAYKEEKRKETLKKRLNLNEAIKRESSLHEKHTNLLEKSPYEPEPIVVKKNPRIVVALEVKENKQDAFLDSEIVSSFKRNKTNRSVKKKTRNRR